MSRNFYNFYYDPYRQGYDDSLWRTLWGDPAVASNQLVLNAATAVHFADVLKGQYTLNVNVPTAPAAGNSRSFGLYHPGRGAYILFDISGSTFSAKTSDGGDNSTSSAITWDSSWTATNLNYVIRWEPGTAKFFINGAQVANITDDSVPGFPLSLYVSNNTWDNLTVKYIDCQGLQSYLLTVGPENSTIQPIVFESETVTVSESVSFFYKHLNFDSVADSITVSEAVTILITTLVPEVSDSVTVSESVTAFVTTHFLSANDTVTITENYAMTLIA